MYKNIRKLYKWMIFFSFMLFVFIFVYIILVFLKVITFRIENKELIILGIFIFLFFLLVLLILKERQERKKIPVNEVNFNLLEKLLEHNENILIILDKDFNISWTNNEKKIMNILGIKKINKLYGTNIEKILKEEYSDIKNNKLKSFFKTFDIEEINLFKITQIKLHIIVFKSYSDLKKNINTTKNKEIFIFFISIDEDVLLGEDLHFFNEQKKQISLFTEIELIQELIDKKIVLQTIEFGEFVLFLNRIELNEIINNDFLFIEKLSKKIKSNFNIEITFSCGLYLKDDNNFNLKANTEEWKIESIKEKYKKSLKALNIAKKRGGDQIVFLSSDETFKTFGEERKKIKINPEVKNIQNAFWKTIVDYDDILIVGHKNADFDSLGSGIALKFLLEKTLPKVKVNFSVKEINEKVVKMMSLIIGEENFKKHVSRNFDLVKWSNQKINKKIIIFVDNNNPDFLDIPIKIQEKFNKICIDHHIDSSKLKKLILNLINPDFSSASEIIMFLIISKFGKDMSKIPSFIYKSLLFGILLDTNNLQNNVNKNTVSVIQYITQNNVDIQKQINILKNYKKRKIDELKEIDGFTIKLIKQNKIILFKESKNNFPEEAAIMAEKFLQDYQIETVFVVLGNGKNIFVSARSSKEFNVQLICTELGGGGTKDRAASVVKNSSIKDVVNKIKRKLNK